MLSSHEFPWMVGTDTATLADAWAALNRWEWHTSIPEPPEPVPDVHVAGWMSGSRRGAIMRAIMDLVGHKECSRAWNTRGENPHMTEEQFETWWTEREAADDLG